MNYELNPERILHPFRRFDSDQVQAGFDDGPGGVGQGDAGRGLGGFAVQDPVLIIILVVGLGDVRHGAGDHAGLIAGGGFADDVREAADQPQECLGFVIGQGGPVRGDAGEVRGLPQNATAPGMGILDIGAGYSCLWRADSGGT